MKKVIVILLLLALLSYVFINFVFKKESDELKIAEAYIDGFFKLYETGVDYMEQGLQLQADYAYGWAAASISSMRYCTDCLLYLKGEGETLEDVVGGRRDNWDEIASLNYASPYPYFFEGLVYHIQDKQDEAASCYEKAIVNPSFNPEYDESLTVLAAMSVDELTFVKKRLTYIEDQIYAAYSPPQVSYMRSHMGFDDKYLRTLARETLEIDETNYQGALRHYQAALAVNPFDGDNFVGCALMYLHMNQTDKAVFFVNEGLFVDPEHQGLNRIADVFNKEEFK